MSQLIVAWWNADIDLSQYWLRQKLVAWQHQVITWTHNDLSSLKPVLDSNFAENIPDITDYKTFENDILAYTHTSSRSQWVNSHEVTLTNISRYNLLIHNKTRQYKAWATFMGCTLREWHDDVIKWKHFLRYWPFARGIYWSPVNCPHKGQWCGALMFSLICAWINGWVNKWDPDDLRCHHAHYDITVMGKVKPCY